MSRNRALAAQQSSDLQSPGLLARLPIIGILMVLIGGSIFGALAYNVQTHGPLLQWDAPLAKEFHAEAVDTPNRIIEFLIFGFFVGKELLQVIVVILSLYFIYKKLWAELAMLLIGAGGGALIWYSIIPIFNRTRPAEQIGIVVHDPSFPSGHTISAVLCYGLLAYLLVPKMPNLFWKWVVVLGAILTIVFIGFSRVFLGGHYLTDIIAGYALGIAWAGLVYTLIESLFLKRRSTTR
ncbi:MAG: phosphatase PAP2 family protein [Anaerolineales bacterium]